MDNFEEYLRQGEPNKAEKAKIWKTAIGLQQVDGLKPSEYLITTAKQNIEGDISFEEVKQRIDSYYEKQRKSHRRGRQGFCPNCRNPKRTNFYFFSSRVFKYSPQTISGYLRSCR